MFNWYGSDVRSSSVQSSAFRVLLGVSLKFMRFLIPHTKSRSVLVPSGWQALAVELPSHGFLSEFST